MQWTLWMDAFWMGESSEYSWPDMVVRILLKETEEVVVEVAAVQDPDPGLVEEVLDQEGVLALDLVVVLDQHHRRQDETDVQNQSRVRNLLQLGLLHVALQDRHPPVEVVDERREGVAQILADQFIDLFAMELRHDKGYPNGTLTGYNFSSNNFLCIISTFFVHPYLIVWFNRGHQSVCTTNNT